jgi:hypothetical protein
MAKNEKAGCVIEAIEKNPRTYYVDYTVGAEDYGDVEDYGENIRYNIAANPNTPPNVLAKMVEVEKNMLFIMEKIAQNRNTPAETLSELAKNEVLRECVAKNKNTSAETLTMLAEDGDPDVRKWVTRNPSATPALLEELGKDGEPYVRKWVAYNPNTPSALLEKLWKDDDPDVRKWVRGAVAFQLNSSSIPAKIGSVKLALAQRLALREGKEVALQGAISRDGKTHDSINASFDREKNRVKLVRAQKEEVKIDPANQVQAIQQTVKQTAAKKQTNTRGKGLK